jgi:hypothetical protein
MKHPMAEYGLSTERYPEVAYLPMRPLIAVELRGRLGNQLLQFAACRVAQGHPGSTLVDSRTVNFKWGKRLDAVLRPGTIEEITQRELLRLHEVPRIPRGQGKSIELWDRITSAHPQWRRQFCEDIRGGLDPRFSGVDAPVLLKGYFFSEEYFVDQAEDIRAAFEEATPAVTEFVCQCEKQANGRPLVAVGFRDAEDFDSLGWTLPDAYYQSALAALPLPPTEYFYVVFGDDRELNVPRASHLLGPSGSFITAHHLGTVDQLNAMSKFDTLIIPNSSFSWWGAWLADMDHDRNATVMAPDPWVYFDNECVPLRWKKIARSGGLTR